MSAKLRVMLLLLIISVIAISTVPLTGSEVSPSVAYAGHTVGGTRCDCGTSGCICDPEEPQSTQPAQPGQTVRTKPTGETGLAPTAPETDLGLLITVFLSMLWLAFRTRS